MILLLLLSFRAPLVKHTPNEHGLNTQTESMYMCFLCIYTYPHEHTNICLWAWHCFNFRDMVNVLTTCLCAYFFSFFFANVYVLYVVYEISHKLNKTLNMIYETPTKTTITTTATTSTTLKVTHMF